MFERGYLFPNSLSAQVKSHTTRCIFHIYLATKHKDIFVVHAGEALLSSWRLQVSRSIRNGENATILKNQKHVGNLEDLLTHSERLFVHLPAHMIMLINHYEQLIPYLHHTQSLFQKCSD